MSFRAGAPVPWRSCPEIIKPPGYDYVEFLVASSRTGSLPGVSDPDAPNVPCMVTIDAMPPSDDVEGMTGESLSTVTELY